MQWLCVLRQYFKPIQIEERFVQLLVRVLAIRSNQAIQRWYFLVSSAMMQSQWAAMNQLMHHLLNPLLRLISPRPMHIVSRTSLLNQYSSLMASAANWWMLWSLTWKRDYLDDHIVCMLHVKLFHSSRNLAMSSVAVQFDQSAQGRRCSACWFQWRNWVLNEYIDHDQLCMWNDSFKCVMTVSTWLSTCYFVYNS